MQRHRRPIVGDRKVLYNVVQNTRPETLVLLGLLPVYAKEGVSKILKCCSDGRNL